MVLRRYSNVQRRLNISHPGIGFETGQQRGAGTQGGRDNGGGVRGDTVEAAAAVKECVVCRVTGTGTLPSARRKHCRLRGAVYTTPNNALVIHSNNICL